MCSLTENTRLCFLFAWVKKSSLRNVCNTSALVGAIIQTNVSDIPLLQKRILMSQHTKRFMCGATNHCRQWQIVTTECIHWTVFVVLRDAHHLRFTTRPAVSRYVQQIGRSLDSIRRIFIIIYFPGYKCVISAPLLKFYRFQDSGAGCHPPSMWSAASESPVVTDTPDSYLCGRGSCFSTFTSIYSFNTSNALKILDFQSLECLSFPLPYFGNGH